MSGGYSAVPADQWSELVGNLRILQRQVEALQMPTGTQIFEATKKLEEALSEIGIYVDAYLASGFTTGSMTATGNVNVGGNVLSGGEGVFPVGVTSTGAYANNLTGVGAYRVAYLGVNGALGYVPSSVQFKQDIAPAVVDVDAVLQIFLATYRYKDAVENLGEDAPREYGPLAEQVHDLGLDWLVDYDDNGQPLGFRYDRLAVASLGALQSLAGRVAALESGAAGDAA